jgi:multicomponent Na+:H+ antiporter subunit D
MPTDPTFIGSVPPGLLLVLAGALLPFLRGPARAVLMLAVPVAVLVWVWILPDGDGRSFEWLGLHLTPVRVDALSRLFATVFAIMTFTGGLFALKQEKTTELASALVYAGSSIGVVFAGDLITVFVFWEAMAVASTLVVISGGSGARGAAQRYIVIHLLGGVLLMAGVAGQVATTGSTNFAAMEPDSVARWLLLAGFLLNTGAPPLSAWLPDAYPRATWSGTVFLSAFTTKTAVYTLIRGFPGADILIFVGLYMVFYGLIYAVIENDTRRKLAYSIVNQVGFMVAATGIGTNLALDGAAAHAFVHILYKALLLMSAGSVLYVTGISKFNRLGGLFRTMPATTICCIVGALSISAFPLTSGFPAKSLIAESALEEHLELVWYLIAAGSAGVLFVGIKLPWYIFFQKDSGLRPPEPPLSMRLAMYLAAALCIGIGLFPAQFYDLLPFPTDFAPYTVPHVVYQLQLLLFSGLAFFLLLRFLKRTETINLDVDWLWRKLLPALGPVLVSIGSWRLWSGLRSGVGRVAAAATYLAAPGALLARSRPTGIMAFWATLLLGAYLVLYYL